MRLLLDTHVWVWSILEPDRIKDSVRYSLGDKENGVWLSPISTWELQLLIRKKRIVVEADADMWIVSALERIRAHEAPLTHEIAREGSRLSLRTNDPADRFLAATARVLDLTLVTADRALLGSKDVPTLAAA